MKSFYFTDSISLIVREHVIFSISFCASFDKLYFSRHL